MDGGREFRDYLLEKPLGNHVRGWSAGKTWSSIHNFYWLDQLYLKESEGSQETIDDAMYRLVCIE